MLNLDEIAAEVKTRLQRVLDDLVAA